ncbi:hypothetical protein BT93_L3189 [Corymbia citriodora subsp. variegata]|uniref:F-box domain-containing protein n=1 Tax=Corymbia citriodora subsp. variegata TaxID=360336 RepID=A0A8T0CX01_CORYI|nr:hypothetical protein BT93_L3189 [Corymbia citriodora subsp. variegata]
MAEHDKGEGKTLAKNWADLPPELLELCSRQLLLEDWFAFRSVCSTWRAAAFKEKFDYPWWMLEDDQSTGTEWAEFYSPFSTQIHRIVLPEVKERRCFSSRGWIFTIGKDWKIHMLNPLSRALSRANDVIELPSAKTLSNWPPGNEEQPDDACRCYINKFFLSASPASSPNYTVLVICFPSGPLNFWKPGYEKWKKLTLSDHPADGVLDVIHYQGQFVALGYGACIFTFDLDGSDPTIQVILDMPPDYPEFQHSIGHSIDKYLVESAGRLLLILRFDLRDRTASFQIFVADLNTRKWTKLESMGNVSLFVGFNSSFSIQVDESQQAIKPNCIYFTCCDDTGIYHMEDGRIEIDKEANHSGDPPLWVESPPLWIELKLTKKPIIVVIHLYGLNLHLYGLNQDFEIALNK